MDQTPVDDNSDRLERFVDSQIFEDQNKIKSGQVATSSCDIDHTLSEKEYNHALVAVQSFIDWWPLYKEFKKQNSQHLTTDQSETEFKKSMKKNMNDLETMIIQLSDYILHTLKLEVHSSGQKESTRVKKFIESRIYPLITYYTSTFGYRCWFSKGATNMYSTVQRRRVQCNKAESWNEIYTQLLENVDFIFRKSSQTTNSNTSTERLCVFYKIISLIINLLLVHEHWRLNFLYPEAQYSTGLLYRGEIMSNEDFKTFHEKIHPEKWQESFEIRTFSDFFCSASTNEYVAKRFMKKGETELKSILYGVHIVSPNQEEMNEFNQYFAEYPLLCECLNIKKFSVFEDEDEVLFTDLNVLIFDSFCLNADNIVEVKCVASPLYIYLTSSIQDHKIVVVKECSQEPSKINHQTIIDCFRMHPDVIPVMYMGYLKNLCIYRFLLQYFKAKGSAYHQQLSWCKTILRDTSDRLQIVKLCHSKV